jgi:hypothetical protein
VKHHQSTNAVETAKINLCEFMNVPYDKNMSVERLDASSFAISMQILLIRFMRRHAAICANKICKFFCQSAQKAVKVARGRFPIGLMQDLEQLFQYRDNFKF